MCDTCGCGTSDEHAIIQRPNESAHNHNHEHHHGHEQTIDVQKDVLTENHLLAESNRDFFNTREITALNLVSSPGSGKTTILENTITAIKSEIPQAVIEGDQQTMRDAERIDKTGVPVVQVNTGTGCHLDAHMIQHAIQKLDLQSKSILFIENVGNLVCPALFDLGEAMKIVIISVTEGDDKPQKYPHMFDAASICIINKIDLLPYVDFNVDQCKKFALEVNYRLKFFELSAKTGDGMDNWIAWLKQQQKS
ncbi:MAG TPA: hydrogenase nickel incorporation protein HypB [Candidatus Marinimicrobia bacterium]|jgi:hydrogenase nickel incorporation protein HypB|nr:hydrogenase nickel incorporation protein HypB [Candidatus Neomarinimicrobiota bacterium]MDP7565860.1 hydrogenase nickel incorporation protein HypB [Candidatus Neomarinimicrobiota bacterium]HJM12356.1 hydrogenase nickel incorporation protein HypB [Candidatus Neomarinimicrobiota bacterium]|tara:strand:- start:12354 stop:13106 length:753 start_codon:yes stop_codon:yes gene_type:complete